MGKIGKAHHLYDMMYGENIFLFIETPTTYFKKILPDMTWDEHVRGRSFPISGPLYNGHCIWIRNKYDWSSLAHECVHCGNAILYEKGVEHDPKNDESLAYYVSFIMTFAMEVIHEDGKRKSKGPKMRSKSKRNDAKSNNLNRTRRR